MCGFRGVLVVVFWLVFCVSVSGCMVYNVIIFFVIVLKDRRLSDFWVV